MENTLYIKPHHLLDIFKLYGTGIELFTPDKEYHHDFYLIANNILDHTYENICFTITNDDICTPCKYAKDNSCSDFFLHNDTLTSKETYNKDIDTILANNLEISFNKSFSFMDILKKLEQEVSFEIISLAWHTSPLLDNQKRFELTNIGIKKYLSN